MVAQSIRNMTFDIRTAESWQRISLCPTGLQTNWPNRCHERRRLNMLRPFWSGWDKPRPNTSTSLAATVAKCNSKVAQQSTPTRTCALEFREFWRSDWTFDQRDCAHVKLFVSEYSFAERKWVSWFQITISIILRSRMADWMEPGALISLQRLDEVFQKTHHSFSLGESSEHTLARGGRSIAASFGNEVKGGGGHPDRHCTLHHIALRIGEQGTRNAAVWKGLKEIWSRLVEQDWTKGSPRGLSFWYSSRQVPGWLSTLALFLQTKRAEIILSTVSQKLNF